MASGFWDIVCTYDKVMRMLSVVVFTFVFLTLLTYPFLEPGTASHAVALLNIGYLTVLLVALGVFRYKCGKETDQFATGRGPSRGR